MVPQIFLRPRDRQREKVGCRKAARLSANVRAQVGSQGGGVVSVKLGVFWERTRGQSLHAAKPDGGTEALGARGVQRPASFAFLRGCCLLHTSHVPPVSQRTALPRHATDPPARLGLPSGSD